MNRVSSVICLLLITHSVDITHLDNKLIFIFFINFIKMKKKKGNHMSITHIKTNKKIEVLLRLLKNNESLEDASSKAGLNIEKTRLILSDKK
jgi:hypothetical protein